MMEAPFTSCVAVTTSSTSSMRAGLRNSICIARTTKAKPGSLALRLREQGAVIGAEQAQIIGAAALHEAQIIGVIDDAGEIGVLVIDPHRHEVAAASGFAVETWPGSFTLLALPEQRNLRRVAGGLGKAEMAEGVRGQHAGRAACAG